MANKMDELRGRSWSQPATAEDVYYCYRLFLRREPDPEGLRFWLDRLTREEFTYSKLAAHFCKSAEYLTSNKAKGLQVVSLPDFEMYVNEDDWDIGAQIAANHRYEPHVTAFLQQTLTAGSVFVDVGANIGYFTLLAAALSGPTGRSIAVECNPENCQLIYKSIIRNGFNNVFVYPVAVSDLEKLLALRCGFSNGEVNEIEEAENCMIVPAVTLDFLLRDEPRVDVIKVDVEGSEASVWRGMSATVQKHHPVIVMEFFPALLEKNSTLSPVELLDEIFAAGYAATVLHGEDRGPGAETPGELMNIWLDRCESVGNRSETYLDVAFQH